MSNLFYIENLKKVLPSSGSDRLDLLVGGRCREGASRLERVPIARLLFDVGFFDPYRGGVDDDVFWDDYTFAVELFHQNDCFKLGVVLRTLNLWFDIVGRGFVGTDSCVHPTLRFIFDKDEFSFVCGIPLDSDSVLLSSALFSYCSHQDVDPDRLKREILSEVV